MAEMTGTLPPSSSNTNKIITAPTSNILLGANLVLLGAVLASQFYLNLRVTEARAEMSEKIKDANAEVTQRIHEAGTEIRLMQMQVQDQTAVMIREGLIKPGDLTKGPTSGGTR